MNELEFISVNEFAKMANTTTQTIYNWIRSANESNRDVHYNDKYYSVHKVAGKLALKKR